MNVHIRFTWLLKWKWIHSRQMFMKSLNVGDPLWGNNDNGCRSVGGTGAWPVPKIHYTLLQLFSFILILRAGYELFNRAGIFKPNVRVRFLMYEYMRMSNLGNSNLLYSDIRLIVIMTPVFESFFSGTADRILVSHIVKCLKGEETLGQPPQPF